MNAETILVVDDEEDFVDILRQMLEPAGYRVVAAADGDEGLAVMRREAPSLMILDVNMPLKNGYEVCREVRTDPRFAELPILMLTIRNQDEEIVRGLEKGADDYLTKPFDRQVLLARIRHLLKRIG
jgi:DNA-binding response OmpR family regulator